jgi:hypothetical protein
MTAVQIRKATENMSFEQACVYIENLNLELVASENYPFLKSWEVKNHKEFSRISNYMNDLIEKKAEVLFGFYEY